MTFFTKHDDGFSIFTFISIIIGVFFSASFKENFIQNTVLHFSVIIEIPTALNLLYRILLELFVL